MILPMIRSRLFGACACAALLAGLAGAFAQGARSRAVDDPPPEPVDCPLCGGNPLLHAQRMLRIEAFQGRLLAYALRW